MTHEDQIDVLGVRVAAITFEGALDRVEGWIKARSTHYVTFTGVHGVMECQSHPDLLAIHNAAGLVAPDGMPMVWAAHHAGVPQAERVYGPDFVLALSERAAHRGWRVFFYGGGDGVADTIAARLADRYPGLQVAGTYTPPFRPLTPTERDEVVALIDASEADLVWVGLSTPKQERWMAEMRPLLEAPVLLGVGAAFDIHAGTLRQAPAWLQERGLEWLFRLVVEPRRLWRRYLSNNPRFVAAVLRRPPRRVTQPAAPMGETDR